MSAAPRNLVNLKDVGISYSGRGILSGVTLGVADGERIGVVGINGGGKSTLLALIAGAEQPDEGLVTRTGGAGLALLGQGDDLDPAKSLRDQLAEGRPAEEWARDPAVRSVLGGLLGGVALERFAQGPDTPVSTLSGGERRRIALARLLLDPPELLLLDEPTNHLDVEGVDWLARHLAARRGALVVVTHDRWFLDAVCTATWEVDGGAVHRYEGGYAAYVLARAERDRQSAASDARRRQLLRKELAWLRRGPPARTSKPKFRIEAANELIADVPEPRDRAELLRFATTRLGSTAVEAEHVRVTFGDREVLAGVTWRIAPGARVALVGVNGSGKTTLLRVLAGNQQPADGRVVRGATVRLAFLTQDAAEIPQQLGVLEALEQVRGAATLADGSELSAGLLCERFGFRGARARTRVGDLSGGERRRLQLMRLLMEGPNVLLLDEPTNDLDVDTLAALEDLLDGWPGTLVVVSHDRYFVERVCDDVFGLDRDGTLRHLPGGIEQYLELRRAAAAVGQPPSPARAAERAPAPGAVLRAARKDVQRLDRELAKLDAREEAVAEAMAEAASDHQRLAELQQQLVQLAQEREAAETAWFAASELLED